MYFLLNPYCIYEKSIYNACIYNLSTGQLINLNKEYCSFLDICEIEGKEIPHKYEQIAYELLNMSLGRIYDKKAYISKLTVGYSLQEELFHNPNSSIYRLYLELSSYCNLDCLFCKAPQSSCRKTGCSKQNYANDLNFEMAKTIIDQITLLGLKQLILMGGEPLLNFSLFRNVVLYAKKKGISNISIVSNIYCITDECVSFLRTENINLNIQLLGIGEGANYLAQKNDYSDAIIENLKKILNINTEFRFLIGEKNQNDLQAAKNYLNKLMLKPKIVIDYLYPGRVDDYSLVNKAQLKKPAFSKVTPLTYSENTKHHNCFAHSIAITSTGIILPCIMQRDLSIGKIYHNTIAQSLATSKYKKMKYLSKDKIQPCNKCSYRYSCLDCRAIQLNPNEINYCEIADCINSCFSI